ncbi:hypothetical protein DB30_04470 [Enhygromyxa salina]|uniref:Uncharacterized protein n=1 Tax=Enhygromyxa salina TaxID=215803 RepID=A0A0C2CZL8_9BACT|nr:hypothetical protein [Enhygromyxa salina]KIG16426.1 hypothetical protein DB30_04470 [Enhygromyxa salina]
MRRATLGGVTLFGMSVLLAGCETDPGTDATTAASAGDSESDSGTDEGEPWEPIPARGDIVLSHVVVNQAVDVPIAVAGVWVGPQDRNTFVVANRDTLLRGFWDIPEDWVDREITGRLDLEFPDGTAVTKELDIFIDAPSYAGDLKRAFTFALIADEFPPGVKYQLSLWEAGPGFEDQRESTTVTKSPIDGLEQIGIQSEPAELKVVLVPVKYEVPGCSTNTAEITEDEEKNFRDYLHEQYPVEQVIMDFRRDSPIEWNQELTSLAQLWQPLRDLRDVDLAAPNVYYYALVDACTGGIDGAGGIAPGLATDTKSAAYERVSSGLWHRTGTYHYETMVHELGHNHGRAHIFCANGDAAGTDPSYPYDDGVIGVWGFGIRLFKLHSPTASWEFMTYCSPTWVSDWGWSKAYNRIRTLTSWDYEGAAPDEGPGSDEGEVLIGLLFKNGTEEWSTTHGAREPEFFSSGEVISFDYAGGEVVASPTNVQILDDGTTMITTMVPRREATFERATRIDAGEPRPIVLQTPETRAYKLRAPAR